jgi:hypothetical protein
MSRSSLVKPAFVLRRRWAGGLPLWLVVESATGEVVWEQRGWEARFEAYEEAARRAARSLRGEDQPDAVRSSCGPSGGAGAESLFAPVFRGEVVVGYAAGGGR